MSNIAVLSSLPASLTTEPQKHAHAYQGSPVRVQVADGHRRDKLGQCHHQEVQVEEELELLVEDLDGRSKTRTGYTGAGVTFNLE